jgi:hypothetical protein
MIDIEFKLNGRKVRPNDIANELERAMLKQIQDNIVEKLRDFRDPETGEVPKVTVKGHSLHDLSFEVSGSEALIAEVNRRLSWAAWAQLSENRKEVIEMAKSNKEVTSAKAASAAAKVLSNPNSSKAAKTAAASALTQRPNKGK